MQWQLPYNDVHYSDANTIGTMTKVQTGQRHVVKSAKNQYRLYKASPICCDTIFLKDDTFVTSLTDLSYRLLCLKQRHLQNCHKIKVAFKMDSCMYGRVLTKQEQRDTVVPDVLLFLNILQASNLRSLLCFVEPDDPSHSKMITLKLLKHIHLEHCPRLEKLFYCSLSLPALESLVILFSDPM